MSTSDLDPSPFDRKPARPRTSKGLESERESVARYEAIWDLSAWVRRHVLRARGRHRTVGAVLMIAGSICLLLALAFVTVSVVDYPARDWRATPATIVSVAPVEGSRYAEARCEYRVASLPESDGTVHEDNCPADTVVGQQIQVFVTPDGAVFTSEDSLIGMIVGITSFLVSVAIPLIAVGRYQWGKPVGG